MLSRSAKASWIEIGSSIATADSTSSRSAKASWIEISPGPAPRPSRPGRGLRRPRGLKFSELRKALIDNRRGLRRPRGLKSSDYTLSPTGLCRGLRRPRGLKYNGQEKIRWWPLSRSAKASWIEIFIKSLIYFD